MPTKQTADVPDMPSERALELHQIACERGENLYEDPESRRYVMTSYYLRNRTYCCGNGCRHCPWSADAQKKAGRPDVPAFPYPASDE